MKPILAALALAGLTSASPFDEPANINYNAVAMIECEGYRGTAFWIARDRIVTAYHVTGERLCTINGVVLRRVHADSMDDVAELTGLPNRHTIRLRCTPPRQGAVLHAVGFAHGRFRHTARLVATGSRDNGVPEPIARGMYIFQGEGAPGMSGGPAFDGSHAVAMVNRGTRVAPYMTQGRAFADTWLCQGGRR